MKRTFVLSLLMVCSSLASAQEEPIKVPLEVKGKTNHFITIKAETKGEAVLWESDSDELALLPSMLLRDSKTAVVQASGPGKYRLFCWGAVDGKPTPLYRITVIVEGKEPTPPPNPVDDFSREIQAAYAADMTANKSSSRDSLAALYQLLAAEALSDTNKTVGDLKDKSQASVKKLLPNGELRAIREIVAKQIVPLVGSDPAAPLDSLRESVAGYYRKAAKAVGECR